MRKTLMAVVAAACTTAASISVPTEAQARCRGCWVGAGIAAGAIGGALLARGAYGYGYGGYGYGYNYGYSYAPAYYGGYGYAPAYGYAPYARRYYGYAPAYPYAYAPYRYARYAYGPMVPRLRYGAYGAPVYGLAPRYRVYPYR